MNCLGIDYGQINVGVAKAEGPLADPLATFVTNEALDSIKQLVDKYAIDEIIVGDCPDDFLIHLQALGKPVRQVDETLSSHDARQSLLHTTQKKRRENEHAVAAAVILQNWLDADTKKV